MSDTPQASDSSAGEITLLLQRADQGDASAAEKMLPLVYGDPRKAELAKLQHFVGLTVEEAAAVLGITDRTARRDWVYARTWLYNEINRLR